MNRMTTKALAILAITLPAVWLFPAEPRRVNGDGQPVPAKGAKRFEAQIAPLLAKHCLECHGPTSKKGGLDLARKNRPLSPAARHGRRSCQANGPRACCGSMSNPERCRRRAVRHCRLKTSNISASGSTKAPIGPRKSPTFPRLSKTAMPESAWVRRLTVPGVHRDRAQPPSA
jgi:hypothetical protein